MAKLLIAHGGAPTAVINASLAGAVREAQKSGKTDGILGAAYGTGGILNEAFLDLSGLDGASLEALLLSPASAIGTSRTPLEQKDYELKCERLRRLGGCRRFARGEQHHAEVLCLGENLFRKTRK